MSATTGWGDPQKVCVGINGTSRNAFGDPPHIHFISPAQTQSMNRNPIPVDRISVRLGALCYLPSSWMTESLLSESSNIFYISLSLLVHLPAFFDPSPPSLLQSARRTKRQHQCMATVIRDRSTIKCPIFSHLPVHHRVHRQFRP